MLSFGQEPRIVSGTEFRDDAWSATAVSSLPAERQGPKSNHEIGSACSPYREAAMLMKVTVENELANHKSPSLPSFPRFPSVEIAIRASLSSLPSVAILFPKLTKTERKGRGVPKSNIANQQFTTTKTDRAVSFLLLVSSVSPSLAFLSSMEQPVMSRPKAHNPPIQRRHRFHLLPPVTAKSRLLPPSPEFCPRHVPRSVNLEYRESLTRVTSRPLWSLKVSYGRLW
jgi:hypothetical protein